MATSTSGSLPQETPSDSATVPIFYARLPEIASEACENAFSSATAYEHASTESWNGSIINSIIKSLVDETSSSASQFKFAVNSTIIQHVPGVSGGGEGGKRGMHSATGAYWNEAKDGMWNWKYEGAEAKGLEVVITVIWISAS